MQTTASATPRGPPLNRKITLKSRPVGAPSLANLELIERPVPEPGDGEFLVRHQWMSLDPYMRGRMYDVKSYAKPLGLGDVMPAGTVGDVVKSRHPEYREGETVLIQGGWQDYGISNGTGARRLDQKSAPVQTALGVLGMPGMTAYCGLLEIGQPRAGETVVVSAATGGVGSIVGQIAKMKGARTVGIAGGPEKCRFARDVLGLDDCVDHRAPDFEAALANACPNGIDVYFENVGGAVQLAVWPLLNDYGRVVICGLIAQGTDPSPRPGPSFMPVLRKRLTVRGFIVTDYASREPQFLRDMAKWIGKDLIKWREDVVEGLDKAPAAFLGMLEGKNFGKLLVKLR